MLQAAISLSQDSRVCVTVIKFILIMASYPSMELNLVYGHLATKEITAKKSTLHQLTRHQEV